MYLFNNGDQVVLRSVSEPPARMMRLRFIGLVGVLIDESSPQSENHDLHIEPERPVLNIIEIVLNPLFE